MKNLISDFIVSSQRAVTGPAGSIDNHTISDVFNGGVARPSYGFSVNRVYFIVLLLSGIFLTYIARVAYLQIFNQSHYAMLSELNKTRESTIIPERGVIYSSDGKLLARNKPSFALEINPAVCGEYCSQLLIQLSSQVDIDLNSAFKELEANRASIIVAAGMPRDTALNIESTLAKYPGVNVIVYPMREYTNPYVYAHVLGYTGLDDTSLAPKIVGKTGVEKSYDSYLTGIPGQKIIEVDATGESNKLISQENSLPGRDITTYINDDLSLKAYELLKQKVDETETTAGVVVAQDPQTGGILALVSYPSFDSNKMSQGMTFEEYDSLVNDPTKPFFNRAISAVYPPGSTFKMVMAAAALEEGTVTRHTSIFDPGYIAVGGSRFNNWNLGGHGEVNLVRALQVSNDTYFYTIGGGYGGVPGLGIQTIHDWANKFGYGKKLGIDIEGESAGYMPDGTSRAWYLGDTFITSIGQGDVLSTALQVNNATVYFANGGYLYQPRIVKSVDGVKNFEPIVLKSNLISKANYDIVREGMLKAVQPGGTGYPVFDFPQKHNGIELGGKTGTSEYIKPDGTPATHALFTVFGPFETEKASIALTVFLEGGGAGSDDATPIARELLDLWFESSESTPLTDNTSDLSAE